MAAERRCLLDLAADEMTFESEVVAVGAVNYGKFLERFHLAKPEHRALFSSEWQM